MRERERERGERRERERERGDEGTRESEVTPWAATSAKCQTGLAPTGEVGYLSHSADGTLCSVTTENVGRKS